MKIANKSTKTIEIFIITSIEGLNKADQRTKSHDINDYYLLFNKIINKEISYF